MVSASSPRARNYFPVAFQVFPLSSVTSVPNNSTAKQSCFFGSRGLPAKSPGEKREREACVSGRAGESHNCRGFQSPARHQNHRAGELGVPVEFASICWSAGAAGVPSGRRGRLHLPGMLPRTPAKLGRW